MKHSGVTKENRNTSPIKRNETQKDAYSPGHIATGQDRTVLGN